MVKMLKKDIHVSHMQTPENKYVKFYRYIVELKKLYRQGWIKKGDLSVDKVESVGDHMFSTALFALLILLEERKDLDAPCVIFMLLLHDVAESLVGDITPHDGVCTEEKFVLEYRALQEIFCDFKEKDVFLELWREYEAQNTAEAKFAKEIDKVDVVLMAHAYKPNGLSEGSLQEFMNNSKKHFTSPVVKKIYQALQ